MDAKKLRQFVEQVAVVIDGNEVGPNGCLSGSKKKKPPKKITKIIENEFGEEEVIEEEEVEYNTSLPFVLKELKPVVKLCEIGCGEIATNQIIQYKYYELPKPHWRTICRKCQKAVGPDGELVTGSVQIQNVFFKHLNREQDK